MTEPYEDEAERWEAFHDAVSVFLDACTPDTDMHIVAKLATQHAEFGLAARR